MIRGPYDGVRNILRFNWPFYLAATIGVVVMSIGAALVDRPGVRSIFAAGAIGSVIGMVITLGVSHLIYDRSDLYRFGWLDRALPGVTPQRAVFCQTGFDETSALLARHLPATSWTLLDHFDAARMTEPSIQRARRYCPPAAGTESAPSDAWPVAAASADLVCGMLAIHELRSETERAAWCAEAHRVLRAGGRVLLVEHVCDAANVLAFGPGALHFHTPASWQRSWERARLRMLDEFRVTPFVRVFVLGPQ